MQERVNYLLDEVIRLQKELELWKQIHYSDEAEIRNLRKEVDFYKEMANGTVPAC